MDGAPDRIGYAQLGDIADSIFEECEEDAALLADRIERMPPSVRDGLLASDFLNAYQVFYFYFRIDPEEIEKERLLLLPASELQYGIQLNEIELNELIFAVIDHEPVMMISDGDRILARFAGPGAYRDALAFLESVLTGDPLR